MHVLRPGVGDEAVAAVAGGRAGLVVAAAAGNECGDNGDEGDEEESRHQLAGVKARVKRAK
jgi:hypothetical protein